MKKISFALSWFLITSIVVLTSIKYFISTNTEIDTGKKQLVSPLVDQANVLGLQQNNLNSGEANKINTVAKTADSRAIVVANFLERYNSPLTPHDYFGQVFVDLADKYEVDFRLLPAIAMQESNLCKKIPEGSYNCLGFGIYGGKTTEFDSFEANFERAIQVLKKIYIDNDKRLTPEDIEKKYTPPSKGSWANSVNQWMAEMRYDDRQLGKENNVNSNVLEFAKNQ